MAVWHKATSMEKSLSTTRSLTRRQLLSAGKQGCSLMASLRRLSPKLLGK